jgi:hypothetical protein
VHRKAYHMSCGVQPPAKPLREFIRLLRWRKKNIEHTWKNCAKPARTVMEMLGQTWKDSKRAVAVARAKRHWEKSMKNDEQV